LHFSTRQPQISDIRNGDVQNFIVLLLNFYPKGQNGGFLVPNFVLFGRNFLNEKLDELKFIGVIAPCHDTTDRGYLLFDVPNFLHFFLA